MKNMVRDLRPTILFLHGGGGGRWMWQPQVERLADYHLLIPDLPGHGDSSSYTSDLDRGCRQPGGGVDPRLTHTEVKHMWWDCRWAPRWPSTCWLRHRSWSIMPWFRAHCSNRWLINGCTIPDFCDFCSIPRSLPFATAAGGRGST